MCVKPPPHGSPCWSCGQRDALQFYPDGFVRSVVRHKCADPVPGPPSPPLVFYQGSRQEADPGYPRDNS